jgi:hypothetical protein
MGAKTFDSKCHDLAQYFCDDAAVVDPQAVNELAAWIQQTVEDYLSLKKPDV